MPAWFDAFAEAVAADEQWYLTCGACGEGTLPPRTVCPDCGATDLSREPLDDRGTVVSFTEISVTVPKFHGETPYTVALVAFDAGVTLTGQLRDATAEDVAIGDRVALGVERREGETPVLTFQPA